MKVYDTYPQIVAKLKEFFERDWSDPWNDEQHIGVIFCVVTAEIPLGRVYENTGR